MKLLTLIVLTLSFSAFAQQGKKKLSFEERKTISLAKIQYLESNAKLLKSCVNSAKNSIDLDQCVENSEKRMKKFVRSKKE